MNGTNPIAHMIKQSEYTGKLQVAEIFRTIQGEGPFSGHRAIFIRLTGCNLACTFCDTTWDDVKDPRMSVTDIVTEVLALTTTHKADMEPMLLPLVVITGGEPCLQPIDDLVMQLQHYLHAHIQLETAGTIFRECMAWKHVDVVVSPKTPTVHGKVRDKATYYKYVISAKDKKDEDTGIPITATQANTPTRTLAPPPEDLPKDHIYLSPCEGYGEDVAANYAEVARLAIKHGYIASVRLHTLMGLR